MRSWWSLCPASSFPTLVSCFRLHQQQQRILSCVSHYCGGCLHCSLSVFCNALLLASELPTFTERLSLWTWILHWNSSRKNVPVNCPTLSTSNFSIVHLVFAFCCAASDINFHIPGHTSRREVFVSLWISPKTMKILPVAFLLVERTLWILCMDTFFLHPRSNNLQSVCPKLNQVMYMLFWKRLCTSTG